MLNEQRLTQAIKAVLDADSPSNQENPNDNLELDNARLKIANGIAKAVIDEIKEAKVLYIAGLTAPNGPVTGSFNHTIS